ncbi:hypothetical protein [Mycobacteroides abscessus]|nr:hypothetical protein [Mycobacteroides abscessus]MDM3924272.1 hypothetical protein [Mycobacteroides abscessus]MDO2967264.1 hypothetical protein [Mycobacteroides abscessus subsp. abscessus]MDO3260989.1 hypothetical protein [Mycobacteroides abscessus subsp. abscessus]MDO3307748.1 hypothetical protein [Mycobacteroides abscessus subsp. abscessus]SIG97727.1 Uncharacterised protein [Mycobacteroides abscessus subsp. abscessus]
MARQLLKHSAFYAALTAISFRLGWWAADRLSSYAQEIDPRIEREYTR